jgi:hypothetical protein
LGCIEGDYRLIASEKLISHFGLSILARYRYADRLPLTVSAMLVRSG